MTDLEILRRVITDLDRISVPVQYTEQIGIPLYNCSGMLKNLHDSIVKAVKEKEEPEIEIVPVEEKEEPENDTVEQSV